MLENKTLLLIKMSYKLDFKPHLLTLKKKKKKNLVNKLKLVRQKKWAMLEYVIFFNDEFESDLCS